MPPEERTRATPPKKMDGLTKLYLTWKIKNLFLLNGTKRVFLQTQKDVELTQNDKKPLQGLTQQPEE